MEEYGFSMMVFSTTAVGKVPIGNAVTAKATPSIEGMAVRSEENDRGWNLHVYNGEKVGRSALTRYFRRSASIAASCRSTLRRSRSRSAAALSVSRLRTRR